MFLPIGSISFKTSKWNGLNGVNIQYCSSEIQMRDLNAMCHTPRHCAQQCIVRCCSRLVVTIVRGEAGHSYCRLFSFFLSPPHFAPIASSITSLQLLLFSHRTLFAHSSHRILDFPRFLFPLHFLDICFLC